ncbi:MAG: hypothetical protein HYY84_12615 [Deltaproteobacteria bacterium]|nr:hypothetical protein [Deltaproteobacteria bacterium]
MRVIVLKVCATVGAISTFGTGRADAGSGDGPRLKRNLVLDRDVIEARTALHLGLTKNARSVAPLSLDLGGALSLFDHFEIGLGVGLSIVDKRGSLSGATILTGTGADDRAANSGYNTEPPHLYALYQFGDWGHGAGIVGVRLDLRFPSGSSNDVDASGYAGSKLGFAVSIPTRFKLADLFGFDLAVGFALTLTDPESTKTLWLAVTPTIQATDDLYFAVTATLTLKAAADLFSATAFDVGLSMQVGVQLSPRVDWYLAFAFTDLNPVAGSSIDGRSLWTGLNFRFGL